jgi:hypothetical protein
VLTIIEGALKGCHELHRCAFGDVTDVPSRREFSVVARLIWFDEVKSTWREADHFHAEARSGISWW